MPHNLRNKLLHITADLLSRPALDYLWLATLGLYIIPVWFEGHALYFGGDIMYPLDPSSNIDYILRTWTDNNGGLIGSSMMYYFLYGFFFLADRIGVSLAMAQRVYLYLNFILPGLGMYFLASVVYSKMRPDGSGKRVACWVAALSYMFCPTLLRQPQVYWFYGVFPFILAFFIQTVDASHWKDKIKFSLLAALFCFGLLLFTPNGQMILVLLLIIMLYALLYLLFNRHSLSRLFGTWLVLGAVVSLVNLGVVLSFLFMVLTQGSQVLARQAIVAWGRLADEAPFAMLRNLSDGIHGLGPEGNMYSPFGFYFGSSPVIYFVNLLLTIAAFGALMLKPKSKTALFLVFYFALVAMVGIVIATGPNPPFEVAWKWLIDHVLVMRIFRTTGQVATIIALGYAVLIGLTISEVFGRLRGKTYTSVKYLTEAGKRSFRRVVSGGIIVIAVGLILANGWPMVTGALYKTPTQWPNNQPHEIPCAYFELAQWVDKQGNSQDYRLMLLPGVTGYQALGWPSGDIYTAAVMPNIARMPTVFSHSGRQGTMAPLLEPTYDASNYDYSLMAKLAGLLNVKYYYVDGYDKAAWGLRGVILAQKVAPFPQIDNATVIHSGAIHQAQRTPYTTPRPDGNIYVAPDWSAYSGDGIFHVDDGGNMVVTSGPKSGFVIQEPMGLDYNTYRYLIVRVKGDSNVMFDVALKRGVYFGQGIIHQQLPIPCQSDYVTYIFEIPPYRIDDPGSADYVTLAAFNSSERPGSAYFGDVILAKDIGEFQSVSTGAKYVQSFDKLSLFAIDDDWVFPRVYATAKVEFINGRVDPDLLKYLDSAKFTGGKPVLFVQDQLNTEQRQFVQGLSSGGRSPQITFQQVNPTRYIVHVENAREPFSLVLSTQFNDFWKAKIDGKEVSEHLMANGYANAWYIDKAGSFTVVLDYQVQTYYHIALVISGLALVGCLGLFGNGFRRQKHACPK